jgi:hypothetical protein
VYNRVSSSVVCTTVLRDAVDVLPVMRQWFDRS